MVRILFTSVGRRVELVQAFKRSAKELNVDLVVYGSDVSENAPALFFCDKTYKSCRISDVNYIPSLIGFCKEENIDFLIPTIDTDLQILSNNKENFGRTKIIVSNPDKISLCRDKRKTVDFFESCGVLTPKLFDNYLSYDLGFPAFIRPLDGSSSINAFMVYNESELSMYASMIKNYIIAKYIKGIEYTVDVFCDFEGNPIYITPRVRLAVRSGEVLKTQISQDEKIKKEVMGIVEKFKPCGAITIQLIRDAESGKDYFIEINPRFGGGAPLSIMAGADSAKALILLSIGEKKSYVDNAAKDGAVFARFDQSIRVK